MSLRLTLLALAALLLLPSVAAAQVSLPNGLVVPVDSANGEVQLSSFFTSRSEPIDWVAEARATPDVFSPLCGFTATLLLHEAGSSLGVGWYNADPARGTPPSAAEIYQVVPAGAAIGTTFSGADIRSDPRYTGGLIGFALIRTPPHFTEARYNTVCSACSTPGPWTLSLTYRSETTANAWYVAFEDGNTSSSSWNNDGDYNDYVFFFTGLSCAGAGEACTVGGALGVCASGLTECDTGGALRCVATTTPGAERCNGADDDCDGMVDDGDLCDSGEVCRFGSCRAACFEGSCNAGETCSVDEGICLEDACATVTCGEGERCRGGSCTGVCSGVVCPGEEVCLGGRCADPCEGVTCDAGRVCDRGVCVEDCSCRPCAAGLTCAASGECVDAACDGVSCTGIEICRGGACVDPCDGAVCPEDEVCTAGHCVARPPSTVDAGSGGTDGGGGDVDAGTGSGDDAGDGEMDGGPRRFVATGSCGCRATTRGAPGAGTLVLLLTLLVATRRRRA